MEVGARRATNAPLFTMLRKALLLLALVVLALACAAYVRGGRPHEVYRTSGRILALSADDRGVFWLEGDANSGDVGAAAFALDGGQGTARQVLAQPNLVSLASAGEALVLLQRSGATGALLSVPRHGGGPTPVAEGLSHPVGLTVAGGEAFWTETAPRLIPGVRHVPATQARVMLRAARLDGSGGSRTVAWLNGGTREFVGELLGAQGERLFVLEVVAGDANEGWSRVVAAPTAGGATETLARSQGPQLGLLTRDAVYWTGPSEDAGEPLSARALFGGPPGAIPSAPLTDWLPPFGKLCETGGRVYMGASDGVWRVPERRGLPVQVVEGPFPARDVAAYGGGLYFSSGPGILLHRALTVSARLRTGLRIR
jgi:hypothetical protein